MKIKTTIHILLKIISLLVITFSVSGCLTDAQELPQSSVSPSRGPHKRRLVPEEEVITLSNKVYMVNPVETNKLQVLNNGVVEDIGTFNGSFQFFESNWILENYRVERNGRSTGEKFYFINDYDVWVTDGTSVGLVKVYDHTVAGGYVYSSNPNYNVGNKFIFYDGNQPFITEGTAETTQTLSAFLSSLSGSPDFNLYYVYADYIQPIDDSSFLIQLVNNQSWSYEMFFVDLSQNAIESITTDFSIQLQGMSTPVSYVKIGDKLYFVSDGYLRAFDKANKTLTTVSNTYVGYYPPYKFGDKILIISGSYWDSEKSVYVYDPAADSMNEVYYDNTGSGQLAWCLHNDSSADRQYYVVKNGVAHIFCELEDWSTQIRKLVVLKTDGTQAGTSVSTALDMDYNTSANQTRGAVVGSTGRILVSVRNVIYEYDGAACSIATDIETKLQSFEAEVAAWMGGGGPYLPQHDLYQPYVIGGKFAIGQGVSVISDGTVDGTKFIDINSITQGDMPAIMNALVKFVAESYQDMVDFNLAIKF